MDKLFFPLILEEAKSCRLEQANVCQSAISVYGLFRRRSVFVEDRRPLAAPYWPTLSHTPFGTVRYGTLCDLGDSSARGPHYLLSTDKKDAIKPCRTDPTVQYSYIIP